MKILKCECPLFKDISPDNVKIFLNDPLIKIKKFVKGEIIINAGDEFKYIAVIKEGKLIGEAFNINGKREVINILEKHDIFGDVLAMSDNNQSPATVSVIIDAEVIFIPYNSILTGFNDIKQKILKNLLKSVSEKYFHQKFRLSCVSQIKLRDKIVCFLKGLQLSADNYQIITVPFDREGMADFLCTDRSALSRELSRMKKQGMIDYDKNTFKFINKNFK